MQLWVWNNLLKVVFAQGAMTGKDNGYTMLLDIESFDYKSFDEGSEGLKVALVHHLVSSKTLVLRTRGESCLAT